MATRQTPGMGSLELSSVIITDPRGRIVSWSHGAERLYGWRSSEVMGRLLVAVMVPEHLAATTRDIMRQTASPPFSPWEGAFVLQRRDGSSVETFASVSPLVVEGRVVGLVAETTPLSGLRPLDVDLMSLEPGTGVRGVIEARLAWFESFLASSRSAISVRDLDLLLDDVLATVANSVGAEAASLLVTDDAGDTLVARATYGWQDESLRPVSIPAGAGVSGRVLAGSSPVIVDELEHVEVHSPDLRVSGFHSYVGVPLVENGEAVGVLHATSIEPGRFSAPDAEALSVLAGPLAAAVVRVRQFAKLANIVNPTALPTLEGVAVHGEYQAADGGPGGGDWFDAMMRRDGSSALMVGDAAGHGLDALASAAAVRHALLAYLHQGQSPAEALEAVQQLVAVANLSGVELLTAHVSAFDPRSRALHSASAGHPPLLHVRDGDASFGTLAGPPISALLPSTSYSTSRLDLRAGDRVVLYTDGIIERKGEALDEGLARLQAAAVRHRHLALPDYVEALMGSNGGVRFSDDRSMLALEVTG